MKPTHRRIVVYQENNSSTVFVVAGLLEHNCLNYKAMIRFKGEKLHRLLWITGNYIYEKDSSDWYDMPVWSMKEFEKIHTAVSKYYLREGKLALYWDMTREGMQTSSEEQMYDIVTEAFL